jgi:hypothetical protein
MRSNNHPFIEPGIMAALKKPLPKPKPQPLTLPQLWAKEVILPKMLIDNWLPMPGAALLVGAHKSGKTILTAQLGIALATAHPFLESYPIAREEQEQEPKPMPVLIVEKDDPNGAASFQQYCKKSPVVKAQKALDDIPFLFADDVPPGLGPAFEQWLESEIVQHKLRFVALDSYTKLRAEHASKDIVKLEQTEMLLLDDLGKRRNCTIVVLHHNSKGSFGMDWSDSIAGSYAMGASVESQIQITRFRDLPETAPERLIRVRGRHFAGLSAVVRFREPTLDYELVMDNSAAELYPLISQLLRQFGKDPFTAKKVCEVTGVSRATAFRYIERLMRAEALIRQEGAYTFTAEIQKYG